MEEIDQIFGDRTSDLVDVDQIGRRIAVGIAGGVQCGAQRLKRPVIRREQAGRGLSDLADAECEDEPVEPDRAARFDGGEQIVGRFLLGALLPQQFLAMLGKPEDIAGAFDQPVLPERLDLFCAETFDVERITRDEMFQPFDRLGRADQPTGAAPDRLALRP